VIVRSERGDGRGSRGVYIDREGDRRVVSGTNWLVVLLRIYEV
jgi:hypothetical protein